MPRVRGTCSICGDPHHSRGWCKIHYERWKRTGDPLTVIRPSAGRPKLHDACSICGEPHYCRGWCRAHYEKWKRLGDPLKELPHHGGQPPGHPSHATKRRLQGSEHPNWAGDQITYKGLHLRIKRERGPASGYECAHADETCKGRMHWANISRQYLGVDDFMPLCASHHYRYDHQAGLCTVIIENLLPSP